VSESAAREADGVPVSVVLPLYQDAETIGATLRGLAAQAGGPAFEVVVIDDGSTDEGPAIAAGLGARVVRQENRGPAAARNAGAGLARGAIVLFLDSDCAPPPDWVARMTAPFADPAVGAVMGTIRAANDGVVPTLVQIEIDERYASMRAARGGVDFIAAPACGFRRARFLALGGFDERLRYAEDVEIGYRFSRAGSGHRIAFVDAAPAAHRHQEAWGEFLRTKFHRAIGRAAVFDLHPGKRRRDDWTPLSLKAQFVLALLVPPALVTALLWPAALAVALAAAAGVVAAGWPLVGAAACRLRPRTGAAVGALVGVLYLFARAWIIAAAIARLKLSRPALPVRAEGGPPMRPPVGQA